MTLFRPGAAAATMLLCVSALPAHAALTANALTANSLVLNALTLNAMSGRSLSAHASGSTSSALAELNGVSVESIVLPQESRR